MNNFKFNTTPALRFGWGAVSNVASEFNIPAATKVQVITDRGIVKSGLLDRVLSPLEAAQAVPVIYDKVEADPPEAVVREAASLARSAEVTAIIGFGGGSSLDVAKLVALLAYGKERLEDIYGVNNVRYKRLPLALIPTTAGTGSEVTPIAVVTTGNSEKKGVVSAVLLPDLALLDPELTISLPPIVTAATGLDAMVHAIEAFTSISGNNNPISKYLARSALSLLAGAIQTAVNNGSDRVARSDMLLGSMLAGQAFANSPVAAVHALAYPLGGHYHVPHGLSNALVLPHVLQFNADVCGDAYAELATIAFPCLADRPMEERASTFIAEIRNLSKMMGVPQRLRDVGVDRSNLTTLATDAMKQTRLLVNNPRSVTLQDAMQIYQNAW
jgi:alcohol dehydrogenase class IV